MAAKYTSLSGLIPPQPIFPNDNDVLPPLNLEGGIAYSNNRPQNTYSKNLDEPHWFTNNYSEPKKVKCHDRCIYRAGFG